MATTVPISSLAAQLRICVARTARRLRQEAGGLSPTIAATLATVERHGPLTPSELADRERVKRPTMTRIVARLEADGLATRTPDPSDGRCALIAATPAGQGLLRDMRTRKDIFLARRLRALDPEDRALLARAVEILERVLDDDRPQGHAHQ